MGRLKFFIFAVILWCVPLVSQSQDWKLVEKSRDGFSIYVDPASIELIKETKSAKYIRAEFLFSLEQPWLLVSGNTQFFVRSITKDVVIDCVSAGMMQVTDSFYSTPVPDGKPVHVKSYTEDSGRTIEINHRSRAMRLLCPFYI